MMHTSGTVQADHRTKGRQGGDGLRSRLREHAHHLEFRYIGAQTLTRRLEWPKIVEWVRPSRGEKVLDVACGSGGLSLRIAQKGCRVWGLDSSHQLIAAGRRISRREQIPAEYCVADAGSMPYRDGAFDKIVCSSSLEHFDNDVAAVREMSRVLRPNGALVLTVDSSLYLRNGQLAERQRTMNHVVNFYDIPSLTNRLQDNGFRVCRSAYLLKPPMWHLLVEIGTRLGWGGRAGKILSLISHPMCLLSDGLLRRRDSGYTIIIDAQRTYEGRALAKECS